MKALQIREPHLSEVVEVAMPDLGAREVLVRVMAVTTCPHWDMHIMDGVPMFPGHTLQYPYSLGQPGHEACGEIAALGADAEGLQVGQRVCVWRDPGHHRPGCYAEYVAVDQENVIPVPDTIAPEALAPLELAMCVSAHVMLAEQLDTIAGKRVGVFGLGPAGLVCSQLLKAAGAAEVVGFETVAERRKLAETLGVDRVLDSASPEAIQFPRRGSAGCLDSAFDCVGKASVVHHALDLASQLVVLFAVQREPYTFAPHLWGGQILAGTRPHTRQAAEYALARITAGTLDLGPLVTCTMPLGDYARGVEMLKSSQALKVAFAPQPN